VYTLLQEKRIPDKKSRLGRKSRLDRKSRLAGSPAAGGGTAEKRILDKSMVLKIEK
jgi:hypothetical protein